jgi:integrase
MGRTASALVHEQMQQQSSSGQIGELERLAHQLEQTSPHRLRHGLAYRLKQSHTPLEEIGRVLGHSKPQVTTNMYGRAFEEDIPGSLDAASRHTG